MSVKRADKGALKRRCWGICDQFLGQKQRVSKHRINKGKTGISEKRTINFLRTHLMRQPQRHGRFQKSDFRSQDVEWTVGRRRPTRSPVGAPLWRRGAEDGRVQRCGLAQHPWQRQQGERGCSPPRFPFVKPATAKPPSFPSTVLFDGRISKLPDRDVGQLQAPLARCTCRASKDTSSHISVFVAAPSQLCTTPDAGSTSSDRLMGGWARTCRPLPDRHIPSRQNSRRIRVWSPS